MARAKDKNVPHYVEVIKRLLKELADPSQASFAELLRFSESTVSAWLRDDKRRPPSPQAYVRMAALARDLDLASEFLNLANIPFDAILTISSHLTGIILQETETDTTKKLVVSGQTFGGMFADGEVITVELLGKDSRELQPFWDAVVLVEFSPTTEDQEDPSIQWRAWPPKKLWVGRLTTKLAQDPFTAFWGVLDPDVPSELFQTLPEFHNWTLGHGEVCIGSWSFGAQRLSDDKVTYSDLREWRKSARQEMKTFEGCRIVGRVVGWLARPEPLKKEDNENAS